MRVYVNFGEWAIPQAIAEGFDGIRCDDSNGRSEAELVPLFVDQPIRPLFLLHDVARNEPLLDALLPVQDRLLDPAIEVFNELEQGRVTPQIYIDGVTAVYRDCAARGFTGHVIAGGLANLSRASLDFYRAVIPQLPHEVWIGFHEYPYGVQFHGRHAWPQTGSPDAAIETLLRLAAGRMVVNTEFGWHTYPEKEGFWIWERTGQLTDDQAYDYLKQDLRRYHALGLPFAAIFQWRDGDNNFLGRFGLHDAEGRPKRQLDAVRDWSLNP